MTTNKPTEHELQLFAIVEKPLVSHKVNKNGEAPYWDVFTTRKDGFMSEKLCRGVGRTLTGAMRNCYFEYTTEQ